MSTSAAEQNKSVTLPGDEEIDIRQVIATLSRRWVWIATGSTVGIVLSALSLIGKKPTYQGEFQIVLGQSGTNSSNSFMSEAAGIAGLAGLSGIGGGDSIGTELEILKSPSVLRPVFESVKSSKPPEVADSMRFKDWVESAITAEQEKNTSVINVTFRDENKQLVLPITKMISKAYQNYSNRGRDRELKNVIAYLKNQIYTMTPIAEESARAAVEYGYENELSIRDGLPLAGNISGAGINGANSFNNIGGPGGSIEETITAAKQKVKTLEVQIEATQKAGTGSIYFASQLGAMTHKSSTFGKLTSVETSLAELRSRLTNNDPTVRRLERERTTLVRYINLQTLALLKGELDLAQAYLKSLIRPREVVARHRKLTQKALRDDATLVTLQNQLKQFELEQSRASSPWELISSPTLLDKPVGIGKRRTLALGLLSGLILGSGGALVRDRRTGRVFSIDELKRELPSPLLKRLPCQSYRTDKASWRPPIQLLCDGVLLGSGSIALIPIGEIDKGALESCATELRRALGDTRELLVSSDLLTTRSAYTQLLITAPGAAKREQLRQLREQLALQGGKVAGWVLLDTGLAAPDAT